MLYRTDIVGLSTEEKPVKCLENGATFYCVDTGDLYIFYKGTWYLQEFVEPTENESKGISLISNNKNIEETKETEEIVEDTRESEIEENEELSIDEK